MPTVLPQAVLEDRTVRAIAQPTGCGAVLKELVALLLGVAELGDDTAFKPLPVTAWQPTSVDEPHLIFACGSGSYSGTGDLGRRVGVCIVGTHLARPFARGQ